MMLEWLFGKPEINRFNALKRKVGFGLAVVIMLDDLPKEFFSTVSDEDWYFIRSNCNTLEQKSKVVEILLNQNKTIDQWRNLYCLSDNQDWWEYPGTIENVAVKKSLEIAKTFKDWQIIFAYNIFDLKACALKKMEKMAKTFKEWQIIYELCDYAPYKCREAIKKHAFEMMKTYR